MTRYLALVLSCLLLLGGAALGSGCTSAHNTYYGKDRYRSDHRPPPPHRDNRYDQRHDQNPDRPPHSYPDRQYR